MHLPEWAWPAPWGYGCCSWPGQSMPPCQVRHQKVMYGVNVTEAAGAVAGQCAGCASRGNEVRGGVCFCRDPRRPVLSLKGNSFIYWDYAWIPVSPLCPNPWTFKGQEQGKARTKLMIVWFMPDRFLRVQDLGSGGGGGGCSSRFSPLDPHLTLTTAHSWHPCSELNGQALIYIPSAIYNAVHSKIM